MGCCAIKSMKITNVTSRTMSINRTLVNSRELVLSLIYRLHDVTVACSNEIENCIILKKRKEALIVKEKQECIKKKLDELQKLIAVLDSCVENLKVSSRARIEIEKSAKRYQKEIMDGSLFDIETNLEGKGNDYMETLKSEMRSYCIDQGIVEKEIDNEIKIQEARAAPEGFIRRRYVRVRPNV